MNHKSYSLIKLVLLIIALGLAIFLTIGEDRRNAVPDQKVVFVLDVNRTMNTEDVFSGDKKMSRLQAAKALIQKTVISGSSFSYGLVLFDAGLDYIIPPTSDTWTFLLYLSWITTNLLPDWIKNFAQLGWLPHDDFTSYLLFSDFDKVQQGSVKLLKWTTLLGIWSLAGDKVRYSNWIMYYDNGKSVFSARNDQFANALHAPYIPISQIGSNIFPGFLHHGLILPLGQRIFLYTLLGIVVILAVLL